MNQEKVSILSTFINFGLAVSKLFFGLAIGSAALVADGVHSGLDIVSSFGTYLGIRAGRKPVDDKHPYGHYRAEVLAGFFVTIFLALSGIWIIWEALGKFFQKEKIVFSIGAIVLIVITIITNELMARLKFYYGRRYGSLSLVADAEHSRADVLSSFGVLVSFFLVKYFAPIDGIVAFLIGGYILFQSFKIGKEITDSLLDVANKDVEERIIKICQAHKVEISDLKTRKIGAFNFAEIKIKLPPKLKVEDVQKVTDTLEDRLLNNIPELKQVVISIEAYQMARSIILSKFGKRMGVLEGFEQIGPQKLGERAIIPLEEEEICSRFGATQYLVIDRKNGETLFKEIIKNPYSEKDSPHGARFAKAVRTDKVFTLQIGDNAKQNLDNFGIKVEIISQDKKLKDILDKIKYENSNSNQRK